MIISDFQLFGLSHIIGLTLTAIIVLIFLQHSNLQKFYQNRFIPKAFAISILLMIPYYQIDYLFVQNNWDPQYHLQLHLSNMILLAIALSFLTKIRIFQVIAFFWGLTGAFFSLLLPDLNQDFPSRDYIEFWAVHMIFVPMVFFIVYYRKLKIQYRDIYLASGFLLLYASIIYPINKHLGANYGYINQPPKFISEIQTWTYYNDFSYILISFVVITLLFHILYGLWKITKMSNYLQARSNN